jgi:hypothetical protein
MKTATQKAASRPGQPLGDGVLVDPGWLAEHIDDPDVRVVEVDVSPAAYDCWHIDGAALWNVYADLNDTDYRTVGAASVELLMARSGIGPDSTVVFYGYAPALGLWLMKLYGHSDARILDCSRDTWRAGGHPWSTAASEPPAARYRLGGEDRRIRADRAAVLDAIDRPGATLVDVRSAAEYRGDCFWPSGGADPDLRAAGHRARRPAAGCRAAGPPGPAAVYLPGRQPPPPRAARRTGRGFVARTRPSRGRCPAQPAAVQVAPGLRRRQRGRALHDPAVPVRGLGRPGSRRRGHPPGGILAWLLCGKAATATSCRPSPLKTTSPKPSAFTASSAAACATSSASHPAQPHASSTSGSSPQPERCAGTHRGAASTQCADLAE